MKESVLTLEMSLPKKTIGYFAGQTLNLVSIETGKINGTEYWAFDEEGNDARWFEIFCKKSQCPTGLQPEEKTQGVVECIRITEGGRPDIFLKSVTKR